jgi:hypothetical protein
MVELYGNKKERHQQEKHQRKAYQNVQAVSSSHPDHMTANKAGSSKFYNEKLFYPL